MITLSLTTASLMIQSMHNLLFPLCLQRLTHKASQAESFQYCIDRKAHHFSLKATLVQRID